MASKKDKFQRQTLVPRFDRVDALRGFALVWMAVFHFCFDLANFRLVEFDFYRDPFWTWQRTIILSTFLLCAGAGQAIAAHNKQSWGRFWRRWAQIVGCAVLVSAASWWMFPRSYITFGVLHGMAVMLIIARASVPLGRWLWPLGVAAVFMPWLISHSFFDTRLTNWIGLVTHKPITEDYVPVLPWLGVMWWGMAATQWMLKHHPEWLAGDAKGKSGDNERPMRLWFKSRRVLVLLGQWSLSFYMLHQPVFIGTLMAWQQWSSRGPAL